MLDLVDRWLEKLEQGALVLSFTALIVLITINIIQRNLLGQSSQVISEHLPALVMWVSLLGASLGMREAAHIRVGLTLGFLPEKSRDVLRRAGCVFGAAVMLIGLYLSYDFMVSELKIFGSKGLSAVIIPIFFAVVAFRFLLHALKPRPAEAT